MKHWKKQLAAVLLCMLACVCLLPGPAALANSFSSVDITVSLDEDGTAHITEVYTGSIDEGTEMYLVKDNMGDMQITDLAVKDETGKQFVNEGAWDVDRSREQKAGKCGLVTKSDGYEVCWGVGDYGSHTYTVSYTMTNLVKGFTDYNGFNVRFFNDQFSAPPDSIRVTIEKPGLTMTTENTRIWFFGMADNGGEIWVKDGKIVATSNRALNSSDNVTIMARFDKNLFTPTSIRDESFSVTEQKALEGSSFEEQDDTSKKKTLWDKIRTVIGFIVMIVRRFFFVIVGLIGLVIVNKKGKQWQGPKRKELKDVPWCRDVPCGGNLPATKYLMEWAREKTEDGAIIGAYLLRWMRQGGIHVEETERKKWLGLGTEMQPSILFDRERWSDVQHSSTEQSLYKLMQEAAGGDEILQEKEFYNWSRENYTRVEGWLANVERDGKTYLRSHGAITSVSSTGIFGIERTRDQMTDTATEMAKQAIGFKKYLKDFTIINERQASEVQLWDEYLVYATLYGIADKVADQFKEIYPQYFTQMQDTQGNMSSMDVYWTMRMIDSISHAAAQGMHAGHSDSISTSSGGGGFSSGGGGGGFSGGGSGGGVR